MHCISCELIIEKSLKKLDWVDLIMVNHKKWIMEINYNKESDYKNVVEVIESNWFSVVENWKDIKVEKSQDIVKSNIIAILLIIIFVMLSQLFDLYSFIPDTSTLSYSSAFLIWIIASVSTCLAITWWIIIWFSKYIDSTKSTKWHIKVQLWFQIWRILWFFVLGWLLWYLWEIFSLWFSFNWILSFLVGFVLLYMWLNILWLFPSVTKFWIHMPKSFASKIEALWKPKYSPIVWALSFFLPCWFTQTMQLLAVSSWSFWVWWTVMFFFALWTFPVLFSVWLWSSYFNEKKYHLLNKIIWAIVVFFWIFTITNSYNLLQINNVSNNDSINTEVNDQEINKNVEFEVVEIWHNWYQTEPSFTKLKKGWNYKIVITPSSNWIGCMSTQIIPKISNKVSYIKKWVPIEYELLNAKAWTYNIVCASMWMSQWQIIVE